jgi:hypothetical protein
MGRTAPAAWCPQELATRGKLLDALQGRLDGLNNALVIEAMLSVENQVFTIWESKQKN